MRHRLWSAVFAGFILALTGCAGSDRAADGSSSFLSAGAPVSAHRAVGPGVIVSSMFGGPIYGWAIDENGTDGLFTEAPLSGPALVSTIETFDQTTGKIAKVVVRQRSKKENHELFADAILANDLGLIDDERDQNLIREDVFDLMSPVAGGAITGHWHPPHRKNLLLEDIPDQQSSSVVPISAIINVLPVVFEVLVADVASGKTRFVLHQPRTVGVNYPYLIAEDTALQQAYVPAASYHSKPIFLAFNLTTGKTSSFLGPNYGPIDGMAVDSTTHVLCTTTHSSYSVQFYNLKSHKLISQVALPGAGGEQQAGYSIATDPINHLFLVEQPLSSVSPSGGSTVFVYDEKGDLAENLNGFSFGPYSGIQVTAATRSGYVAGPGANQLESFTY
jgi:hypothetical protein